MQGQLALTQERLEVAKRKVSYSEERERERELAPAGCGKECY